MAKRITNGPPCGRPVVLVVHGIRTRGEWGKHIAPVLANANFIPYPLDFGNFSAWQLLSANAREEKLAWLREMYHRIRKETGIERPSIIAHSFGTWLLGALLSRYDDVVFDKLVLNGSILPSNFGWAKLLNEQRVLGVRNEIGSIDPWPRVASFVQPRTFGTAGVTGFSDQHAALQQFTQEIGHSDSLYHARFEAWADWLSIPTVPPEDFEDLGAILWHCRQKFPGDAKISDVDMSALRICLLTPNGRTLVVPDVPDAAIGLSEVERLLCIPLDVESSFIAARSFNGNMACAWAHPDPYLTEPLPQLSFVATAPLRHPADGRLIGVLGIDSAQLDLELPHLGELKRAITIAARKVSGIYADNSNGVR